MRKNSRSYWYNKKKAGLQHDAHAADHALGRVAAGGGGGGGRGATVPEMMRGMSHCSHLLSAGWLWNVQT